MRAYESSFSWFWLPQTGTRCVRLTFSSLCPLFKAVPLANLSHIKRDILGNAKNQTRSCWVSSKYATSVLCSTSRWGKFAQKSEHFDWAFQFLWKVPLLCKCGFVWEEDVSFLSLHVRCQALFRLFRGDDVIKTKQQQLWNHSDGKKKINKRIIPFLFFLEFDICCYKWLCVLSLALSLSSSPSLSLSLFYVHILSLALWISHYHLPFHSFCLSALWSKHFFLHWQINFQQYIYSSLLFSPHNYFASFPVLLFCSTSFQLKKTKSSFASSVEHFLSIRLSFYLPQTCLSSFFVQAGSFVPLTQFH